ncbi:MAG: TonB-dependent receptor [Gemmatimonadaceae bacterium]
MRLAQFLNSTATAVLLLLIPASVLAQASAARSISGIVILGDGTPVLDATASIEEFHLKSRTDARGRFSFTRLPAAAFTLTVQSPGMRPVTLTGVHPGDAVPDVTLHPSTTVIPAVTVTASRAAAVTGSSVLPVSELSEGRLRRDATISLAHSMIRLPGVRSVSTGEQIGKPMIRGFFGARVLTLSNGSRLEDYSWSDEDAPSVDARLAQRVEVIRGPASVLYGSDAVGGVINVIPFDLPVSVGGESVRRYGAEIYGASNNLETGGSINAEGASGRVGWQARGIGRLAQSYRAPSGEIDNTGFLSVNGDAAIAVRGDRSNSTLRFSHYGGEFKLLEARGPGSAPAAGSEEGGPERKLADDRLQYANDFVLPQVRLETKAQFQRHSLIEVSDDLCTLQPAACANAPIDGPMERPAFDLLLNTGSLDFLAHHSLASVLHGVAGVSGLLQANDSRGPIFLVPSATVRSAAAFVFEELTIGKVVFAGGARIDTRHLSADANPSLALGDVRRDWTEPSGSLGLVFRPLPQISVVANGGVAWRAPTLFELYANGPHLAEGRYEIGDRSLATERARNLDVGVRWQGPRVAAEVSGFRNAVSDFVYISPTGETRDGLMVYRHLQSAALLSGAEASGQFAVSPQLVVNARHDFVRGTNRDTDAPLPLMPPPRTAGGIEYYFDRSPGAPFAGVEVEHNARQSRPGPDDFVTGGYSLVNIDAGFQHSLFGKPARFDVALRNAANREYRSFLSRYKEFASEPGRSLIVRVSTTP